MADGGGQKKANLPGKVTFGGGEFWKPKVAETPRREARRLFLECVAEVEPHVLSDLRDHVLPLYVKAKGQEGKANKWVLGNQGFYGVKVLRENGRYADWFESWIRCYYLDTPWVREVSQITLAWWTLAVRQGIRPQLEWVVHSASRPSEDEVDPTFRFKHQGVYLTHKTRREAEEIIRAKFEEALTAHFNRLLANYERAGYHRTPQKQAKKARDHFLWLAEFQVKRQSYEKICKRWEPNSTSHMVERAIKRLAKFLELPLRPRSSKDFDDMHITFPPYRERQRFDDDDDNNEEMSGE